MKIRSVEPILAALPYEQGAPKPASTATVSWENVNILFVRVETEDGIVGWGEAFAISGGELTAKAVRDIVAKLAVGRTITNASQLSDALRRQTNSLARAGGPVAFALSALDIALWDIDGKIAGKPVSALLGGVGRKTIAAYASLFRLGAPNHVAKVCTDAVARGYRSIKLHEYTVEAVAAARAAAGPDVEITVDVNCHWTSMDEVVAFCAAVAPYNISWLEEPLYPSDDYAMHAALRQRVETRIAAGENLGNLNDLKSMVAAGGVDILQPSVAKVGGITEVWRSALLAREKGVTFVPHSPFHGPALAAAMHIVAALPEAVSCELRYCDLGANPMHPIGEAQDGRLVIPEGPGLGIEVDAGVIKRYRVD